MACRGTIEIHATMCPLQAAADEVRPTRAGAINLNRTRSLCAPRRPLGGKFARDPAFRIGSIAMNQQNASAGMTDGHDEGEPWGGLLASAGPRDHIVQLYQDQEFLNRAVCRFAASAIANGEGVILVPTEAHWDAFRPRLEAEGVDTKAAQDVRTTLGRRCRRAIAAVHARRHAGRAHLPRAGGGCDWQSA